MRRYYAFLMVVAFAFLGIAPAIAQDAPSYTTVQEMEMAPGDAEVLAAQVKIVAEAAAEANIGPDFAWNVYRWDNTFWFVSSSPSLADLEDPEAMARAFQGTSVEAKVFAAFERVNGLTVLSSNTEVMQVDPEMGYAPANPALEGGSGGAMIIEQWVKADQRAAFNESTKAFMAFLAEVGGPYPVLFAEDIVGDGGVSFIVIFDNLSNFFGKNSMESLVGENATPDLVAGMAAHARTISREESQLMNYLPDLSYQPGNN